MRSERPVLLCNINNFINLLLTANVYWMLTVSGAEDTKTSNWTHAFWGSRSNLGPTACAGKGSCGSLAI